MTRAFALALCLAALCACGRGESARETEALRMRVERLEREAADDRARQAGDLAALRAELAALRESLDEASRHVAALSGPEAGTAPENAAKPPKPQKSPRAALKESLSGALETSKQAVHRLGRELDKALTRKPARPETSGAPEKADPSGQPAKPE